MYIERDDKQLECLAQEVPPSSTEVLGREDWSAYRNVRFDSRFFPNFSIRAFRIWFIDWSAYRLFPNFSIRAFRAYLLVGIGQAAPYRAIRGNGTSVNSTLPPLLGA